MSNSIRTKRNIGLQMGLVQEIIKKPPRSSLHKHVQGGCNNA